jgi:hypothetical protein
MYPLYWTSRKGGIFMCARRAHVSTGVSPEQGGNLSPLLANVYLNEFDQEFQKRGVPFVRYADDIVLLELSSRRSVQSIRPALEKIKVYARGWLNYYGLADMKKPIEDINGWLYHRIRMCIWKQWKKPKTKMRIPNGTYGAVRGRRLVTASYSISVPFRSKAASYFVCPLHISFGYWDNNDV